MVDDLQGDFLDALAPVKSAAKSGTPAAGVKSPEPVGLKPNAGWGKKKEETAEVTSPKREEISDERIAAIVTEMTEPFRKTILELVQVRKNALCDFFFSPPSLKIFFVTGSTASD